MNCKSRKPTKAILGVLPLSIVWLGLSSCKLSEKIKARAKVNHSCVDSMSNQNTLGIDLPALSAPLPEKALVSGAIPKITIADPKTVVLGSWCLDFEGTLNLADPTTSPLATLKFTVPTPSESGVIAVQFTAQDGSTKIFAPETTTRDDQHWTFNVVTAIVSGVYSVTLGTDLTTAVSAQPVAATATTTAEGSVALAGSHSEIEVQGAPPGTVWNLKEIKGSQLPPSSIGNVYQAITVLGDSSPSAAVSATFTVKNVSEQGLGLWALAVFDPDNGGTALADPRYTVIPVTSPPAAMISNKQLRLLRSR